MRVRNNNFSSSLCEIVEFYEDSFDSFDNIDRFGMGIDLDEIYPCSDYIYDKGCNGRVKYGYFQENNVDEILEIKRKMI